MQEEIGQILEQLKLKNLSVAKVEKALGYSNGTLGKARDGKINLPAEKMEKLRAYAKIHLEKPALDGQIIATENCVFDVEKLNERIKELEWVGKTKEWCKVKGFPPSELIEKYERLELQITELEALTHPFETLNKPKTAPKTEKKGKTTPKQEKTKDEAENGHKTLEDVKSMCPTHLSGLDRSIWIAENRKKYNV